MRTGRAESRPNPASCIFRNRGACAGNTNRRRKSCFWWMGPTCGSTFPQTERPAGRRSEKVPTGGRRWRSIEIIGPTPGGAAVEKPSAPENTLLRCVPRVNSGDTGDEVKEVLLEANSDGYLTRIVIEQPGNLTTEFRFGGWEETLPIAETKFHFLPPAGVTVVDEATLAGGLR